MAQYAVVAGGGHGVEEAADGLARDDVALGERAEADCAGAACEVFELGGPGDVVPGHVLLDVILGDAGGVYLDLDGAGGIGDGGDELVEAFRGEVLDDFVAEGVVADCADDG